MKRKLLLAMLMIGIVFSYSNAQVQTEQSDSDSLECLKNFSLYSLSYKKKMYDYAIEPWRDMFNNCPSTTVRIYSDGINLYEHYIAKEKDAVRKNELIDTLLMIYDQRIQYFGDHAKYPEGWILGRKGLDIVRYRRNQSEALQEAYDCFNASYQKLNLKMEPLVALNWIQTANILREKEKVTPDEFLEIYLNVDDILGSYIKKETKESKISMLNKISSACVKILSNSGFDNCEQLENSMSMRYEAVKDDAAAVGRILRLLNNLECTEGVLFAKAAEQNYKLEPSDMAAYFLAKLFVKKGDIEKAKHYYSEAISASVLDANKAKWYYELALITFSHDKNGPKAREMAYKSIQFNKAWGKPYILIGNIYAQESNNYGSNDFEHKTVYWVALDQYKKAKNIDPECSSEAQKQINLYSQYMPDQETGFFHGIQEGQSYTVGSWINEETVVRYR